MKRIDGITRPLFKRLTGKLIVSITLLAVLFPLSLFATPPSDVHLTILHVNDTHGRILPYEETGSGGNAVVGGAAYLARMIQNERQKNPEGTLLLSAGDMFQGSPISSIFRGRPVIDIMNYLKFDALAIGNHEFDWGYDMFNDFVMSFRFPLLSANMKYEKDRYLPGVRPYIIVHRKHVNIAVIGIITPETQYVSKPDPSGKITFLDPESVLPGIIKKVKDEGAQVVVVLSHLGIDQDIKLARRVSGIHVIVGGHSHTTMETPVTVGNTTIVQAGGYGLYLGVLELKIETETDPVSYRVVRRSLKKVLAGPDHGYDETVARIVQNYHDQIKDEFARVIGETSVDLIRNDQRESNIGNLVCDMMKETTGADIAFLNSRAIRADIPRGKITLEQFFTLLPFDNTLVTVNLTGRQILEILEHNLTLPYGGLQVSGLRIKHDASNPAGHRVKEVRLGARTLDMNNTYRIVTNDFLAAGGDRFITFMEGQNILYGMDLREAFLSYLKKHSPVQPRIEERIIINKSYHIPSHSLSDHVSIFIRDHYPPISRLYHPHK